MAKEIVKRPPRRPPLFKAIKVASFALRLDPNNLGGMDVLAALLAKDKKSGKELEALASKVQVVID